MGAAYSAFLETFPPPTKFTVDEIPNLKGKVVIVTGANTGVGREIVRDFQALLAHNAKVYLAARNPEKAEEAIAALKKQTGHEAIFLRVDLGDLNSVKAAAEIFLSKEKDLHILFNNAGVMAPPKDQVTSQGYDLQFGTNVLGHFYLTRLLVPALILGAKSSPDGKARVVTTSSGAHIFGGINFNTLRDGPARRRTITWLLYAQSKFGDVVFANELARRYGGRGIVSISCNPGNFHSDLQRHLSTIQKLMLRPILYSTSQGALTQLYAGTSTEGANLNGKYLVPWARLGSPNPGTTNADIGRALWTWLEEQV